MTDLAADYAAAGFDGHLPFGTSPALLMVDVCNAYLDPASPLYAGVEDALAANIRLLAASRRVGIPAVFTRVLYNADGTDGGLFYRKVPALAAYLPGNPLGEFPAGFGPEPGDVVVTKQYASAFFGTSLAATLNALRVDSLLITGFSTSGCVRATALDALQNGFAPFVVRDGCGDRAAGPHEANLFDLQAKYAEVIDEQRALALIANPRPA